MLLGGHGVSFLIASINGAAFSWFTTTFARFADGVHGIVVKVKFSGFRSTMENVNSKTKPPRVVVNVTAMNIHASKRTKQTLTAWGVITQANYGLG